MARTTKSKKFLLILFIIFIGAIAYTINKPGKIDPSKKATHSDAKSSSKAADNKGSISMLLTGDWIAHDSVNTAAKQPSGVYDYSSLVSAYQPLFNQTDIKFCNDPILNGGAALGITGYPKFNSPTDFVSNMGSFGCNLVNIASNHSFDFTQANIDASVDAWAKVPNMLAVAGENKNLEQHDKINYFTQKGVKFAFLAYTAYSNSPPTNGYGVNEYSEVVAGSQIQQAKAGGAQIIIVSMRWGVEYSATVSPAQEKAAQFLADQGANLVIGHGPHVLQPVQELSGTGGNKTLVWYSVGNFLNSQVPPETLFNGVGLLDIDTKSFAIKPVGFLPFNVHYEWTAEQARADDTNARKNLKMYLLENTTQSLIDSQQLKTTVSEQRQRMTTTLSARGQIIPLISLKQALR